MIRKNAEAGDPRIALFTYERFEDRPFPTPSAARRESERGGDESRLTCWKHILATFVRL
jgi:hypothetical protein